jgi:acetolactate synthase-1/2/3 large subunit
MKLSDYVSKFLVDNGINFIFTIAGGGIMHLLDSVSKQKNLKVIYNHHEQASAIFADSYSQFKNGLSACLVTTGPGATNAITGCAGSWLDSNPVLFISGQTKTSDLGHTNNLRQKGAQEIGIIPMVSSITKYSVMVTNPIEIKYHLEKALFYALNGRRGPVWLDIPLNVQSAIINPEELIGFIPEKPNDFSNYNENYIDEVVKLLNSSKRPVILLGHGAAISKNINDLKKIINLFEIPTLVTWRAIGLFSDNDPFYFGSPGAPGLRYSNYILQNSDLLIVIGSRLNSALTAYDESNFAPKAAKIIVDIDINELRKFSMPINIKINTSSDKFINDLVLNKNKINKNNYDLWNNYARRLKNKYPFYKEKQNVNFPNFVDSYLFNHKLSNYIIKDDVIVGSSSGRTCIFSHLGLSYNENQKFITSMGLGAMGWCIPSAIASCIVSDKKRTIVLEGDGSLQTNIHELALIKPLNLPIKIFIFNNNGYSSLYLMQKNNFNSNFAGCDKQTDLFIPDIPNVARLYSLNYIKITNNNEIDDKLNIIMKNNDSFICEIVIPIEYDEVPKSKTKVNLDGSFSSSKLENLYPFLSDEEHNENMKVDE